MEFNKVDYTKLNARQQENYNFAKISSALADYGYNCIRISADWNGADFIAHHVNNIDTLLVQQKSRFVINKKYLGKNLLISYIHQGTIYLYDHDSIVKTCDKLGIITNTDSWKVKGSYSNSNCKELNSYMTKL
jgi:hypothetical protein